jgi:hypothetical protein
MNQEQNKRLNEIKNSAHPIILMVDEMIKKDNMLKILLNPETKNGRVLKAIHGCILSKLANPRYYAIVNGIFTPMIILYEHDLIYREVMNLYIQGVASNIKNFEFKNNIGSPLRLNEFTKRHNTTEV